MMGIFEVRLSCALQKGSVTVKNVGMNIDEGKGRECMELKKLLSDMIDLCLAAGR